MSAGPGTAARQAAVLMTMLDDDGAAGVLRLLDPADLREIGRAMIALDVVAPADVAASLSELTATVAGQGLVTPEPAKRLERVLVQAHGVDRADGLMARIRPAARESALEFARWLEPSVLARLLADEHPQAIALLLTTLDSDVGAQVLGRLPDDLHPQVLHRIATLQPVTAAALELLEEAVAQRVTQLHGATALALGGAGDAAALLNAAARAMEARALPAVAAIDVDVARAISDELVTFAHLLALDTRSIGAVLRVVDGEVLLLALKGLADAEREVFFAAMSSRAADGVRDDMAARGRVAMADVLAAQKTVIAQARSLAESGEIALGGGGDDYA